MKNPTIKQVAFLSVVFFGWALVAGAGNIPVSVTTGSSTDSVVLGISGTLHEQRGQHLGGRRINGSVRITSIGGTYGDAPLRFPPPRGSTASTALGTSKAPRAAYIPASRNAPELALTTNGASVSGSITTAPAIGGAANAPSR